MLMFFLSLCTLLSGCGVNKQEFILNQLDVSKIPDCYEANRNIFGEFTGCVFAETWMAEGQEKYGRIYCENIDPAIAYGYNENLVCQHDKIMYDDKKCTFCFYMKDKGQDQKEGD